MTNYNSNYEGTVPFSDTCVQVALATGTEQTYTIPGDATMKYQIRFSYISTANIFIGLNVTAADVSAGTSTTTAYLEFRPGSDGSKRYAKGTDVIHLITPDTAAYVGIALTKLPG
jgi:hypothetical protein